MKKLFFLIFLITNFLNANEANLKKDKEKLLKYKEKITKLKNSDYSSDIPLTFLKIVHKKDIGDSYKLISLKYLLNNKEIFFNFKVDKNKIIYEDYIIPGKYKLVVEAVYMGNEEGVFDYLNNYRVKVKREKVFSTKSGQFFNIESKSRQRGFIFTSFKNRPDIVFEISESLIKKEKE
jgi:hypothetical protein